MAVKLSGESEVRITRKQGTMGTKQALLPEKTHLQMILQEEMLARAELLRENGCSPIEIVRAVQQTALTLRHERAYN